MQKISLFFTILLIFTGCEYREDENLTSKGVIVSIYESKEHIKISVVDTIGRVFFAKKSLCEKCSIGDSVKIVYHDNSLIHGSEDKLEVDSFIRFYNSSWVPEKISKTLYFYDDSNRIIKRIDTIFVKK
jgi:hypothetical protein